METIRAFKKTIIKEIVKIGLFIVFDCNNKKSWFEFKNGSFSQYIVNIPEIPSNPEIFMWINWLIVETIKKNKINFNRLIGVPNGALPFAYVVAGNIKFPCLTVRKEGGKEYNFKGDLSGAFEKGDRVLIIEDGVCTGETVIGLANRLKKEGLIISDVVAICNTEKTGRENLKKEGIKLHNLFALNDFAKVYRNSSKNEINPII